MPGLVISGGNAVFSGQVSAVTGSFANITLGGLLNTAGKTNYATGNGVMIGNYLGNAYLGITKDLGGGNIQGIWVASTDGVVHMTGADVSGGTITGSELRIGASTFNVASGAGFWAGLDSGSYKMRVGDSNEYMSWSPGIGLKLKLAPFTASVPAGDLVATVASGSALGSRTVSISGGTAPYTYAWSLQQTSGGPGALNITGGGSTATVTISIAGMSGWQGQGIVTCTVTDSNNREAKGSFTVRGEIS
jgi:hypothetical protein